MANIPPIQFKRSHTQGSIPAANQLEIAEIALNLADGLIYSKDSDGTIVSLGGSGGGGSIKDYAISTSYSVNDVLKNTGTGELYTVETAISNSNTATIDALTQAGTIRRIGSPGVYATYNALAAANAASETYPTGTYLVLESGMLYTHLNDGTNDLQLVEYTTPQVEWTGDLVYNIINDNSVVNQTTAINYYTALTGVTKIPSGHSGWVLVENSFIDLAYHFKNDGGTYSIYGSATNIDGMVKTIAGSDYVYDVSANQGSRWSLAPIASGATYVVSTDTEVTALATGSLVYVRDNLNIFHPTAPVLSTMTNATEINGTVYGYDGTFVAAFNSSQNGGTVFFEARSSLQHYSNAFGLWTADYAINGTAAQLALDNVITTTFTGNKPAITTWQQGPRDVSGYDAGFFTLYYTDGTTETQNFSSAAGTFNVNASRKPCDKFVWTGTSNYGAHPGLKIQQFTGVNYTASPLAGGDYYKFQNTGVSSADLEAR